MNMLTPFRFGDELVMIMLTPFRLGDEWVTYLQRIPRRG